MKYLINTGCSYGVMFRSMKEFTNGNDTDFQIIDLHCDSHGAEYQKRSIEYTISNLLGNGADPKNIYVIVEFSQPNRLFTELPIENSQYMLNDTDGLEGIFILNNKFERQEDSNLIQKYKSLNVILGDRVYINPELDDFSEYDDSNQFYLEKFKEIASISNKPIDRLEQYLNNILALQSFLKSYSINYTFFLMNNTFEGYDTKFRHITSENETYQALNNEIIELPDYKTNRVMIHEFSEYGKSIWNLIDFENFVFYKTDKMQYGGIDEYAMEKFGHIAYTSGANLWDIPEDGYVTSFGAHPHDSIYINFFNDYIYDRIRDFIGELKFDFTDRWSTTKHNAIRK